MECKKHGKLTQELFYIQKCEGKWSVPRCKLCCREAARKSARKRRLEIAEWNRNDRRKNPERYKIYAKRYLEKYPGKKNAQQIARKRGITVAQYQQMFIDQDNKCAICGKEETKMMKDKIVKLMLDHDHKTGKNRELLCHLCNVAIGGFNDNIDLMESAIYYLRKHK